MSPSDHETPKSSGNVEMVSTVYYFQCCKTSLIQALTAYKMQCLDRWLLKTGQENNSETYRSGKSIFFVISPSFVILKNVTHSLEPEMPSYIAYVLDVYFSFWARRQRSLVETLCWVGKNSWTLSSTRWRDGQTTPCLCSVAITRTVAHTRIRRPCCSSMM